MKRKIKKYSTILLLATILSSLGHAGSILFYIGVFVIYLPVRNKRVVKDTKYLFIPIIIALYIGLFQMPYTLYEVFKDVFYLLSPIVMLMLGEIFARKMYSQDFLMTIVIVGTVFSVITICGNLVTSGPLILYDPRTARESDTYFGFTNFYSLLAWFVLCYWKIYKKNVEFKNISILLFINFIAIYFSGSRTYWLAVIVVMLCLFYPYLKVKRYVLIILIAMVFAGVSYILVSEGYMSGYIRHSFEEMTISDYDNEADKNNNYRGYEAFMGLSEFMSYSLYNQLFGGGMGATVDMGEDSPVGIQYIPILHNGYIYLLIKIGILGTIFFVFYFLRLIFRYGKWKVSINDGYDFFWKAISFGSIIAVFIMHFSVTAFFNSQYNTALVFVGFTLTYMKRKKLNDSIKQSIS